jgi:hypothetical protein
MRFFLILSISPIKMIRHYFFYSKHISKSYICLDESNLQIFETNGKIIMISVFVEFWWPSWTPSGIS